MLYKKKVYESCVLNDVSLARLTRLLQAGQEVKKILQTSIVQRLSLIFFVFKKARVPHFSLRSATHHSAVRHKIINKNKRAAAKPVQAV